MKHTHSLTILFKAKSEKIDELRKELRSIPVLVANEKDLLAIKICENLFLPGDFVLYEEWVSEEARLKHSEKQYVIDFFERIQPLLGDSHYYMAGQMKNGDEE